MNDSTTYRCSIKGYPAGIIRWIVVVALLTMASVAGAQEVKLDASFSRDTLWIGDQADFTFQVEQPAGLHLNLPEFTDTLPGGIEILKTLQSDTIREKEGRILIQRKYRVTSFDTTTVVVPPLEVSYEKDSLRVVLATPPLSLVVKAMPVDTTTVIADIKEPYNAPLTFVELLPWILGLLILLAAGYFVYRYLEKRKEQKHAVPQKVKPSEPAHVIALRDLNQLREEKLWQKGEVKKYYTRLSDILRLYLENRYDLPAMEQTTPEILSGLRDLGFSDRKLFSTLQDILETADLVKFAKHKPQPDKNEAVMLDAVVFVNGTRPAWKSEESEEEKRSGENEPVPATTMIEEEGNRDG